MALRRRYLVKITLLPSSNFKLLVMADFVPLTNICYYYCITIIIIMKCKKSHQISIIFMCTPVCCMLQCCKMTDQRPIHNFIDATVPQVSSHTHTQQ